MQKKIFPKEIANDITELYLPKVSVKGQLIYLSVLCFIFVVFALLPFIKVDVSVKSTGVLRTILEKGKLKAPSSGMITAINVKDNQSIKKGDLLFQLDARSLDNQLKLNRTQREEQYKLIQDLNTLLSLKNFEKPLVLISNLYSQQYNSLYFALLEKKSQINKATLDLNRTKLLYNKKVVATSEMEDKQFAFDKLQAEYKTLIETQRNQWASDLNNLQQKLKELSSQNKQIKQEKSNYKVKAPISGIFQLNSGKYRGDYVQAGESLGVISPDSNLIAECYLSSRDIGLVKKGMKVKLQIDAFNYNDWGFISAEVIDIDKDYIIIQEKPVFRAKCRLATNIIQLKDGFQGKLKRGMTLQARFVITQRSLYQLLYDNIDNWINPSTNKN